MKSMMSQEFDRIYYMQSQSNAVSKMIKPAQYNNQKSSKWLGAVAEKSSMSSLGGPYQAEPFHKSISHNN